jgi:hypothetical protein
MTATGVPHAERAAPMYDGSGTPPVAHPARSGLAMRFLERFALIAFALYHVPFFLNNYPSLGGGGFNDTGLAPQWGRVFTIPSIWVAKVVFHVAAPGGATGDNGDTSEEYARLFICIVVGLIAALAWTIADRRRPRGEWVESTTRVLLRFSIVLGLLSYGIAKILPQQFPPVPMSTLDRRVGELTPMALLWTFMEYSRPYAFFGGVMELLACALLCFRRTATLGALVCLAVMTNVMLLNFMYGVPVKLYATMIVLSAAVLVLYDSPRLLDFFVRNRAVGPSRESTILQDHVPRVWRRLLKVGAVGSVALSSVVAMWGTLTPPQPSSPLEGVWSVPPSPTTSWRRIIFANNAFVVRTMSDSVFRCSFRNTQASTLAIDCPEHHTGQLQWTRSVDTLRLQGAVGTARVDVTASLIQRSSYQLMRSRFRWFFE